MSFIDTRFPETYAYGAIASDDWQTEVVETLNRREKRNAPSANPRRSWDLSTTHRTQDERDGIHRYFLAMRGMLHAFPFRDLQDYEMVRQTILTTGDSPDVTYQLSKTYTIGSETYRRDITKPVTSTVRVWIGGVLQTTGYSVSRTTGIVTFNTPPAGTVQAECQFDVPVRFAQAKLSWSAPNRHAGDLLYVCDSLGLIEVIGE